MNSKFSLIKQLDERYQSEFLQGKISEKTYIACSVYLVIELKNIMLSSENKGKIIFFLKKGSIDENSTLQQLKDLFNINPN